jgi:hypothetical protein
MIALPPVDPADFIMKSGDELLKCINKYFDEIPLEEAVRADILDSRYTPELLDQIQAEYYTALKSIWDTIPLHYRADFEAVYETPKMEEIGDLDALEQAYQKAVRRTLWERLSRNEKDVFEFKNRLKSYCEALLWTMHSRFIDIVAEIN